MPASDPTPYQIFIAKVLEALPKTRNFYDRQLQEILGTTGKPLYDAQRKKGAPPKRETLKAMSKVLGQPMELFDRAIDGEIVEPRGGDTPPEDCVEHADMVGIHNIDQSYGLGATFIDSHVAVEVLQFPKVFIDAITSSPPALLTWARGKGDSMEPTIRDGDLVLIDRSQRRVEEQDAMWAYTVGDMGAIKRLRVKGDRFQIFSDNPSVPDDEEPIDFVNIVGRVVFVGMRK